MFYIEKSNLTGNKGDLFLKDNRGHCHLLESVKRLLESETFRDHNRRLIPTFEKAKEMMEKGQTGIVDEDS